MKERHYISSTFEVIALMVMENDTTSTYFAETDHLGSIIGLLNADKSYADRASFNAWGRRRNPADWSYLNVPVPQITDRGFTGHEHLDQFGLINMNGRMYDPVLGRFLGVDPLVQSPDFSQSFNGYSYCFNNPLIYTDQSGYTAAVVEIDPKNYAKFIAQVLYYNLDWLADEYKSNEYPTVQDYLYELEKQAIPGGNGGWFFGNENAAYNYMWLASNLKNREQPNGMEHGAWIAPNGVFVLPTAGWNYQGTKWLSNTNGNTEIDYYEIEWYDKDKSWGSKNKMYFIDPLVLGVIEIIGFLHTHPPGADPYFSPGDLWWVRKFNGLPCILMDYDGSIHGEYWDGNSREPIKELYGINKDNLTNTDTGTKLIPILLKYQ